MKHLTDFLSSHGIEGGQTIDYSKAIQLLEAFEKKICPKVKKAFIPPTRDEFVKFFIDNGYKAEIAINAFNGYSVADWKDSKGSQIKNWKQKCHFVWFKPEHKATQVVQPLMKSNGFKTEIRNN